MEVARNHILVKVPGIRVVIAVSPVNNLPVMFIKSGVTENLFLFDSLRDGILLTNGKDELLNKVSGMSPEFPSHLLIPNYNIKGLVWLTLWACQPKCINAKTSGAHPGPKVMMAVAIKEVINLISTLEGQS